MKYTLPYLLLAALLMAQPANAFFDNINVNYDYPSVINNHKNYNNQNAHSESISSSEVINSTSNDVKNDVTIKWDSAASSAASTFAGACAIGAAGQGFTGGWSIGNSGAICDHLRMVDAYLNLAKISEKEEDQKRFVAKAISHLESADFVVEKTSDTAFIAKLSTDIAIPVGLIALFFIL